MQGTPRQGQIQKQTRESATRAGAGWSRRRGCWCTKTAIWPTSPGTTWPTMAPATRNSVNAVPTGRSPTCEWTRPVPTAGLSVPATAVAHAPPFRPVRCPEFHSRLSLGNSPGCASPRRSPLKLRQNYRNNYPVARLAREFHTGDPASPPPELPESAPGDVPRLYSYEQNNLSAVAQGILRLADRIRETALRLR